MNKIVISKIAIEVTRRCNLKCRHCCRGDAENVNIDFKHIDTLLSRIFYINQLTFTGGEPSLNVPAIQYFADECKRLEIGVYFVSIVTNGINIKQDFIDVCIDLSRIAERISVCLSNDKYHTEQRMYDDSLLQCLPFFSKKCSDCDPEIMAEGRGELLKEASFTAKTVNFYSYPNKSYLTLNVHGEIINGIDWSYINQWCHKLCNVENLHKLYKYERV
jgi:organic radical activating enzyme